MLRIARRACLLFGAYVALLVAVIVAGFIGQRVGIWASVLWGLALLAAVTFVVRQRLNQSRAGS